MRANIKEIRHPDAKFSFKAFEIEENGKKHYVSLYRTSGDSQYIFSDPNIIIIKNLPDFIEVSDAFVAATIAYLEAKEQFNKICRPFLWENVKLLS